MNQDLHAPEGSSSNQFGEGRGARRSRGHGTRWILIGSVIALAIIGMSFLKLDEDIVLFMTPAEAKAQAPDLTEKTVRVGGMVKPRIGKTNWAVKYTYRVKRHSFAPILR